MIAFRYRLKNVPMKVAEKAFTRRRRRSSRPARSSSPAGGGPAGGAEPRSSARPDRVGALGGCRPCRRTTPTSPRVAIYSQWSGTQELGWYRHAFDQFGIPFDLIYKERVKKGNLKADYDVIIMAAQNINRAQVMAPPAARPQPYLKSDKYKFLGMYGETPDMSGGFGQEGVDAFEKFLEGRRHAHHDAQRRALPDRVRLRAVGGHRSGARASTRRSRWCRPRS